MQSITIRLNNDKKLNFILELLKSFNFIEDIKTEKTIKSNLDLTFKKNKSKASINDFAGIWSKNPKSLEQIREKGWKRNL